MPSSYYRLFVCIFIFLFYSSGFTQEDTSKNKKQTFDEMFDDFLNESDQNFSDFQIQQENDFNKFLSEVDKEFADFLGKAWTEFNFEEPLKPTIKPKPISIPIYRDTSIILKSQKLEIQKLSVPIKRRNIDQRNFRNFDKEFNTTDSEVVSFDFFNNQVVLNYDKKTNKVSYNEINPNTIRQCWIYYASGNYNNLLNSLLGYKSVFKLNDWGYYTLVNQASRRICNNNYTLSNLLSWFILNKSGYDVRIGYANNTVYLLFRTNHTIYGNRYYIINGNNYYSLEKGVTRLLIYPDRSYKDTKIFDFTIIEPIDLGGETKKRQFNFDFKNFKKEITLEYPINYINFIETHPWVSYEVYFNSKITDVTRESFHHAFDYLLKDLSEYDAVSLLLNFTQTCFQYKTDKDQFAKEKFLFPDETVKYPFSDCEDRSIFFSYLVRELLGLEVIGLDYGSHVSTAVYFNESGINGEYFLIDDKKFVACDPTYTNAPVGKSMSKYSMKSAKIIYMNK